MKKIGYFFFSFIPLLLVILIQIIACIFVVELTLLGMLLTGDTHRAFSHIMGLLTDSDFNGLVMIAYTLITIPLFGFWFYKKYGGQLAPSFKKRFKWNYALGALVIVPGGQFLSAYICGAIQVIYPKWMEQYEQLLENAGLSNDLTPILFIYAVLLGPICEEIIFRGVILHSVKRALPFWAANIFQAILFGIFHMNWVQGIYAFSIGILFGFVCEKGKSIYYSIFSHLLFNLWGTTISLIVSEDSEILGYLSIPITIVSLALGIALFTIRPDSKSLRSQDIQVSS